MAVHGAALRSFLNVHCMHPGGSKGGYGLGRAQLTAAPAAARSTRALARRWAWREVVAIEAGATSYEELYEPVTTAWLY